MAPLGAVVKHTVVPKEMHKAVLRARPYNSEEEAIAAVLHHDVQPGDAVIIRYEGPKGSGMPEMFYTTEAIASDPLLGASIALITDGRYSGASKGPAISASSLSSADHLKLRKVMSPSPAGGDGSSGSSPGSLDVTTLRSE